MRTPQTWVMCLSLSICPACSTPDYAGEFAAAALASPPGQTCRIFVQDGAIVRYVAAIAPTAIPPAARRMAGEFMDPGGELVFAGREWYPGDGTTGYRTVKRYRAGHKTTRRSALVSADGTVLGRTHEIAASASPADALAAVSRLLLGQVTRVEVVAGRAGTADRYRYTLVDGQGRRWTVLCSDTGTVLEQARVLTAEISIGETDT